MRTFSVKLYDPGWGYGSKARKTIKRFTIFLTDADTLPTTYWEEFIFRQFVPFMAVFYLTVSDTLVHGQGRARGQI